MKFPNQIHNKLEKDRTQRPKDYRKFLSGEKEKRQKQSNMYLTNYGFLRKKVPCSVLITMPGQGWSLGRNSTQVERILERVCAPFSVLKFKEVGKTPEQSDCVLCLGRCGLENFANNCFRTKHDVQGLETHVLFKDNCQT